MGIFLQVNGRYKFSICPKNQAGPDIRKNPTDRSAHKRKLQYWIDLAKLLDRDGTNALFLADTYG